MGFDNELLALLLMNWSNVSQFIESVAFFYGNLRRAYRRISFLHLRMRFQAMKMTMTMNLWRYDQKHEKEYNQCTKNEEGNEEQDSF